MAIFELSEMKCRLKFQICVKGRSRGFEKVDKVGIYLKFVKSSIKPSFWFISIWDHI